MARICSMGLDANVGRIKSRPSRMLRPAPRRRAIVAPRFGKWARVLESSMETEANPPGKTKLPRFNVLVPCSGRGAVGREHSCLPHYLIPSNLCYLSRYTAGTGVTLNSPSYCPDSSSARQVVSVLSEWALKRMQDQDHCASTLACSYFSQENSLCSYRSYKACQTEGFPRVLADATEIDPNFFPRGRQAGGIPTRPTPREFRKPAFQLP